MQEKGWIKIHRGIEDSWVYRDPLLFKIWISLILMANYKPNKILIKGNLIELERGQFFTSIRNLAEKFETSKNTIKRKLDLLEKDKMIVVDSRHNVGTLITVLNYEKFQAKTDADWDTDRDTDEDTGEDNSANLYGTIFDTEQEYKKYKESKKERNKGLRPSCDPWGNKFE